VIGNSASQPSKKYIDGDKQALFDIGVRKKKFASSFRIVTRWRRKLAKQVYCQVENCLQIEPKVRNCANGEKTQAVKLISSWNAPGKKGD